jgi:hypothetical protein
MNLSATPSEYNISMSNQPKGEIIKHFTISRTVHHLIDGLVTLNDVNLNQELADEIKADGGTHIVNLKVNYNMPFIYGLVNLITWDLYSPFELNVEGDVVK